MYRLYILIALIAVSCGNHNANDRIKPRVGDITESVYASVTVRPQFSYFPQSTRSGIIQEVMIEEGDMVKKGQVLLRIAATADVNNRLTTAELNLMEAKANYLGENNLLKNLEAELASTSDQLHLDSTNYERTKRLWEKQIGTKVDLDRAKLLYESSVNKVEVLRKKYAQTKLNLSNSYKKAQSMVATEQRLMGDYVVRSLIDGKVYKLNKEAGELINQQERFAEIGSADSFVVEMDIDEVDVTKIAIGDSVIINLEAYPDKVFLARTTRIAPQKDELTQTFRVESVFEEKPARLYDGLSGEANIMVARRKEALVIPASFLVDGNKVLTEEGETVVEIGVKNMDFVEVLSGIDASTELIKPEEQ
jgi:HlyD family secretion protein